MASYVKQNLVGSERIVYVGKIHSFCYVPSILTLLIGFVMAGWVPEIPVDVANNEMVTGLQSDLVEKAASLKTQAESLSYELGLWEPMVALMKILAEMRRYYIGFLVIIFSILNIIKIYCHKISTEQVITTRKIILKKGLVSVDTVELNLERIEGVKVKQTAFDRMIGRGDILISGVGMEQIELVHLVSPARFRQAVLRTMEHYSKFSNRPSI